MVVVPGNGKGLDGKTEAGEDVVKVGRHGHLEGAKINLKHLSGRKQG